MATGLVLIACNTVQAVPVTDMQTKDTQARKAADAQTPLSLIPAPASLQYGQGHVSIDATTPLRAHGEGAAVAAAQFADLLARTRGLHLQLETAADDAVPGPSAFRPSAPGIDLTLDPALSGDAAESYRLRIGPEGVDLRAGDAAGLFYGAVTLWQLLTADDAATSPARLPVLRIDDAPRFRWRGYMLDSARHFHSVDEIKGIIDALSLHKLNVFHWHLTDDQGWRVEIKRYPKLTEVGGCRIPVGDAGIDAATGTPRRYCGWYTQAQIRDVVAYAAQRHITVVPEIDVPGHATAAIAAYPELGVTGAQLPVSSERGIHSNLFNVEEDTLVFLEHVFDEVVDLFPGRYIHVGGDEAVKDQWKASPRVQQRMRELGLADEAALQSWFIRRLDRFLTGKGRQLIGWDEILEGGLPPAATVMSWRGTEGGIEAARQGHDVVMSPTTDLYLDYLQTSSPNEPAGRPKTNTLQTFYAFEPVPAALEPGQRGHILGLQANMWTGDTRTFAGVEHNTFPRLAAVAETGWTPAANKHFDDFIARLPAQLQRYRALGIGYAQTPFEVMLEEVPPDQVMPDSTSRNTAPTPGARVALSNALGYPVHYTLDGSDPAPDASQYRQPLDIALPATLRARAFSHGRPLAAIDTFRIDAASLLTRSDEQLALCPGNTGPVLRMEDDGPDNGPRALFNVPIFALCWTWPSAPLQGIDAIRVRAGRLPYMFQLGAEDSQRRYLPATTAHGELDIRSGGCEGPVLASAPLPAAPDADGFITVQAQVAPGTPHAPQDLCIRFSGDTRPTMWVLDRITLLPAAPR
ncbi:beta-N-acetylhexosaminidase [Luteimonas sp. RIT-PG2_3]